MEVGVRTLPDGRLVGKSDLPPEVEAVGHAVIGSAIEVHKVLGPGLLEGIYEDALMYELEQLGMNVRRQAGAPVIYKGCRLREQTLDLIVEDSIVVELKAIERLADIHRVQLLSYLRITNLPLGFLFNFNVLLLMEGFQRVYNERADPLPRPSWRASVPTSVSSR